MAESERASAAATELRQQVAKQEKELSELAAELQDARAAMEAAMKSAGVSVTASLEVGVRGYILHIYMRSSNFGAGAREGKKVCI